MKQVINRSWRLKGKLKVLTILLFIFSILFITYQVVSYVAITNYQEEEAHALHELNQRFQAQKHKYSVVSGAGLVKNSVKPRVSAVDEHDHSDGVAKYYRKLSISPILGVSPSNWKLYSKPLTSVADSSGFVCIASGNEISWEKVNDDYCDCPVDGSDEPSTNACMNGRFFCTKTLVKYPDHVPSSRVNDNICDCCDGSDEVFTRVHCAKHC